MLQCQIKIGPFESFSRVSKGTDTQCNPASRDVRLKKMMPLMLVVLEGNDKFLFGHLDTLFGFSMTCLTCQGDQA